MATITLTPEELAALKGADGTDGKNGADSIIPGPKGEKGDTGPQGPAGANGIDGKDATSPATIIGSSGLWLDSFPGTSDDTKLDAAIAASQIGSVRRPILLANREYSFAKLRTLTSGFKLINPFGFGNQLRGANSIPCHIKFTGIGAWWTLAPGSVFDIEFAGFGVTATNTTGPTQFIRTGQSVLWTSKLHDLGFLNWTNILGTPTEKALITAVELSGWWNVNNARGTSFTLGGSDSRLWIDGMLIDSHGTMAATDYHIRFASMQKSDIGGIYMTAENCHGIHVSGSATDGHLVFDKMRVEGRNASAPSNGLMHIASGRVKVRDSWFGFTKADYITQAGGELAMSGCDFGLSGVAATAGEKTVLKQSAGTARLSDLTTNWGNAPVASGPNVIKDSSIS
jgi:hypothetical protein